MTCASQFLRLSWNDFPLVAQSSNLLDFFILLFKVYLICFPQITELFSLLIHLYFLASQPKSNLCNQVLILMFDIWRKVAKIIGGETEHFS